MRASTRIVFSLVATTALAFQARAACPVFASDPVEASNRLSFNNSGNLLVPEGTCYAWSLLERSLLQGAVFRRGLPADSAQAVKEKLEALARGEPQVFRGVASINELSSKYKNILKPYLITRQAEMRSLEYSKNGLVGEWQGASVLRLSKQGTSQAEYFAALCAPAISGSFLAEGKSFCPNNTRMLSRLKDELAAGHYPILSLRSSTWAHAVVPISVRKLPNDKTEILIVNSTDPKKTDTILCQGSSCSIGGQIFAALGIFTKDFRSQSEGLSEARCRLEAETNKSVDEASAQKAARLKH
ncbi:MAG: hypothetical protein ABIO95_05260 [Bdellovibrionota bacterium]